MFILQEEDSFSTSTLSKIYFEDVHLYTDEFNLGARNTFPSGFFSGPIFHFRILIRNNVLRSEEENNYDNLINKLTGRQKNRKNKKVSDITQN